MHPTANLDAAARPGHADDLAELRAAAFALLERGATDRHSPLHTPILATLGLDGAPRARILVLRGFDAASRTFRLHGDRRSEKFAELAREPRCALQGYDPAAQVQLRLEGIASLHSEDAVAEAAWQASRPAERALYSAGPHPGTAIAAPLPAPRDEAAGRAHFGVILVQAHRLEWLWLAAEGHRRARIEWLHGEERATWLVP